MMRRLAAGAGVAVLFVGMASPAWAAPTTEVIQGRILRLVSVADWEAAGALLPGDQVQWDVAVSADAPDPGTVTIGVSATGDAPLVVDVAICGQAWESGGCPGGAVSLRSAWEVPRDGAEVELAEMPDTDVAHVRLGIALGAGAHDGSTNLRVHASGDGEAVVVGPEGGLASTGLSPSVPLVAGGAVLAALGLASLVSRRRGRADRERHSGSLG
ncbi:hypothetical protein [Microbacterium sp. PMB16]|uniref:hypothetical protein n=1 Tax=Microbacterium sp. PMB16 TaxID=3120157 RepID=UPI003F4C231D